MECIHISTGGIVSFILLVTVVILLVVAPQGVDGACSHTVGVEHLASSLDPHLMHMSTVNAEIPLSPMMHLAHTLLTLQSPTMSVDSNLGMPHSSTHFLHTHIYTCI